MIGHRNPRPEIPSGPWLVAGLARSGQAAARALVARGETVIGVDSGSPEGAEELEDLGVEVHLQHDGVEFLDSVAGVIKSPGVPTAAGVIQAALKADMLIMGELELGWRLSTGPVIAVTGTNGKTTTVEMIGHILSHAGIPCDVVGNVGRPISSLAGLPHDDSTLVVEASSFQLEDADQFAPEISVVLNVGTDHIDRHGTITEYHEAKLKILDRQGKQDVAVVPPGLDVSGRGLAHRVTFGAPDSTLAFREGNLLWEGEAVAAQDDVVIPGIHNLLNAQAAAAVCLISGVQPAQLVAGLRSFQGVAHRLELVLEARGVKWFNDSKATNVDSTLTALESLDGHVHLILGGDGKGQDFTPLRAAVAAKCLSLHLIGEAAGQLEEALLDSGVHLQHDGDLRLAVASCARTARSGDVVLLSPACASFDQFSNFEERGLAFRAFVEAAE
ncbi:MAG: UDP-N-acetylmuramoyl-L-alanine--D-glutamate ligase [Solirubrobacterales bacterium]|nr:UDP-N-acetylmuramoyl-L-alanine--D-glutamate ligase [Solirubrobacterales bacterium]